MSKGDAESAESPLQSDSHGPQAGRATTLGLFPVTLATLAFQVLLTLLCVIVPAAVRSGFGAARDAAPWLLVFAGMGIGFMTIEISQMERLIVFLGHPTYALTVVLFVLLLASGLGSLTTSRIPDESIARSGTVRFALLLLALALFGPLTPPITAALRGSETPPGCMESWRRQMMSMGRGTQ